MESKQLDLDHQVLVSDVKTDLIPLVNVEPNVNREHENPFNESKMRKYDIKLVIFFILVLCLTVVALALGLVSVLNKQSRGMRLRTLAEILIMKTCCCCRASAIFIN